MLSGRPRAPVGVAVSVASWTAGGAPATAVKLSVAVDEVVVAGVMLAVTPGGSPVIARSMGPVELLMRSIVIGVLDENPASTDALSGPVTTKSGVAAGAGLSKVRSSIAIGRSTPSDPGAPTTIE